MARGSRTWRSTATWPTAPSSRSSSPRLPDEALSREPARCPRQELNLRTRGLEVGADRGEPPCARHHSRIAPHGLGANRRSRRGHAPPRRRGRAPFPAVVGFRGGAEEETLPTGGVCRPAEPLAIEPQPGLYAHNGSCTI